MYQAKNPVLLVVFNRPDETRRLLTAVSRVRPPRLYVSADAPRSGRPDDNRRCEQTLQLFENLEWPCKLELHIENANIGSHSHIPRAVTWFFEKEESGIVLEDDCIPTEDFFRFCDEALALYSEVDSVMWVNGSNGGYDSLRKKGNPYGFSRYAISWGWASWRRAWAGFDPGEKPAFRWRDPSRDAGYRPLGSSWLARRFWYFGFKYAFSIKNWDWRWLCYMSSKQGHAVTPYFNMVSNIGYGIEAVHGGSSRHRQANLPTRPLPSQPLTRQRLAYDTVLDRHLERQLYRIGLLRMAKLALVSALPEARNLIRRVRGKQI